MLQKPSITIGGVKVTFNKVTFNINTGKIEFHLNATFTGKKFMAWKEKNSFAILEAIKELAPEIIKKVTKKKKPSKKN